MSHGKYRAVKVKNINWEKINKSTQGREVVFSIDAAKEDVYAALMVDKERAIVTMKWKHPVETRDVIEQISKGVKCKSLAVAIEPSGTYGDPLIHHFRQAGVAVYLVSPKKTYDAKELYDGVPSLHDGKSAYVIGRLHLDGNSKLWKQMPEKQRELNALIGTLGIYQKAYQSNKNRLEGKLARHWPEVLALLSLDSVTLESLLIEYGSAAAIAANADKAKQLMVRIGRTGLREEKINDVLRSAQQTLGVPCIAAEREAMQALAQELKHLRLLLKATQQRVEQASVEDKNICCLGEVVGRVTAAVLVAKLGSPLEYPSSSSYVKAAGLNLKEKSSGKLKGQLKLSKRGSSLVRMYLYFVSMRMIRTEPVVRAWYKEKVKRDGGKVKMKALIAVMRKITKALWYVGQGEVFDSRRLFNCQVLNLD